MKQISMNKLSQILLEGDTRYELIRYIYKVQGFDLARLDYDAAAESIKVSSRTVGRAVKQLSDRGLLVIQDGKLRLHDRLQKIG